MQSTIVASRLEGAALTASFDEFLRKDDVANDGESGKA